MGSKKQNSLVGLRKTEKLPHSKGDGGGGVQLWAYIGPAKEQPSNQPQTPLLCQFFTSQNHLRLEQTFLQKAWTNGQQVHEEMLNTLAIQKM